MAFNSANGSKLTVGATDLHVATYRLRNGIRDVENTHSGTGGFTNFEKVVNAPEWEAEGPLDEDNLPDVDAGLAPGSKVAITFKEGADSRTIVLTNTLVVDFEIIANNANDIMRWRASGKGATAVTNHTT